MGALLSKQAAHPTHAPGCFYNCELAGSSIKELRTIRARTTEAFRASGRDEASIAAELRPLEDEIRRREQGPNPVQ